ncbi:MAG: hypothetical protein JXL97_06660 [Bacteroidales bacterium]|nr:hypothetical protein [Bacteroidales bacterium]
MKKIYFLALVMSLSFTSVFSQHLIKDINEGSGSSINSKYVQMNDIFFFKANDGIHGEELWVTDGTEEGTILIDIDTNGSATSDPAKFTVIGDLMYFYAENDTFYGEPWISDGTAEGTYMLKDINSNLDSSGGSSGASNFIPTNVKFNSLKIRI